MKKEEPEDREYNLRMLKAARREFENLLTGMQATAKRLQAEELDAVPTGQISNFSKAIQNVFEIEAKLAKRSYEQRSGGEGACPLDLAAARREVFERLAARNPDRESGGTA